MGTCLARVACGGVVDARCSQPLHMSSFTMDDFEGALRHSVIEPHCQLLAEIHATLIYNLRTVPFNRHSAIMSLMNLKDEQGDDEFLGVTMDQLTDAMVDVGSNWERAPLRHAEGREGWEESMVGCLKDVSTAVYCQAIVGPHATSTAARNHGELPSAAGGPDAAALCSGTVPAPRTVELSGPYTCREPCASASLHTYGAWPALPQTSTQGPCGHHLIHVQPGCLEQGHPHAHGDVRGTAYCVAEREDRGEPHKEAVVRVQSPVRRPICSPFFTSQPRRDGRSPGRGQS